MLLFHAAIAMGNDRESKLLLTMEEFEGIEYNLGHALSICLGIQKSLCEQYIVKV